jgi:hypothetical protein
VRIETNAKFGAFFLSRCGVNADLPDEEELRPGLWVSRRLGIEIAEHWRTWLGSIVADSMREDGVGMYATAPSNTPEIADGENVALERRATDLFNGLTLQGAPAFERGCVVHGANINGQIQIRGYGQVDQHYRTPGIHFRVGLAQVLRALTLSDQLRHVQNSGPESWTRLQRGIRTLLLANRQTNAAGDRLHEFVRALEAVVKPRIKSNLNDFTHRGQTLALNNTETSNALRELYAIRSAVEHLNVPTDALPQGGTEAQQRMRVDLRTGQAERIARHAFIRILESPDLMAAFRTDDHIDAFWQAAHGDRIRRWGERLDIIE